MDNFQYNFMSLSNTFSNDNLMKNINSIEQNKHSSFKHSNFIKHPIYLNKTQNIDFTNLSKELKSLSEITKNSQISIECSIDKTNNTESESLKCNTSKEYKKREYKIKNLEEYITARNQLTKLNIVMNYHSSDIKLDEGKREYENDILMKKIYEKNPNSVTKKMSIKNKSISNKYRKLIFKVINSKELKEENCLYHHIYGRINIKSLNNCEKDWEKYLETCQTNSKHQFIKKHFEDTYSLISYYQKIHIKKMKTERHIHGEKFTINYKKFPISNENNENNLLPKKIWETNKFDKNIINNTLLNVERHWNFKGYSFNSDHILQFIYENPSRISDIPDMVKNSDKDLKIFLEQKK